MIDPSKILASTPCARCGTAIGHIHVNLHRNEERFLENGRNLAVAHPKILSSYCMNCGVEAARADLMQLGFFPLDVEDYENTRFCTSCEEVRVDLNEWHPTYLIAVGVLDKKGLCTLEETTVVIACADCEAKYGPWFEGSHLRLAHVQYKLRNAFLATFQSRAALRAE